MQKAKAYIRKTRKGKIVKVVTEHYLRDDLWCGVEGCEDCQQSEDVKLSADAKQYLMFDTNIILRYFDLIEANPEAFENCIYLQTVLEEIRHRHRKLYIRLRNKIAQSPKGHYVFSNEHHRGTYIERLPKESPNDRNDRAIRVATGWYNSHIQERCPVVMISNDVGNLTKAKEASIPCTNIRDYVKNLGAEFQKIKDMLAQMDAEPELEDPDAPYPRHLNDVELAAGIETGKLKKGIYKVNRDYYSEASVQVKGSFVFIPGGKSFNNRAVDGDEVAIEVLPESEWRVPSRRLAPPATEEEEEAREIGGVPEKGKVATGKVVGIVQRNWGVYCGSLELTDQAQGNCLFLCVRRTIPKIRIESKQIQALMDKRIMVAMDNWPATSRYPQGHYVSTMGVIGDPKVESEIILQEHEVPHLPWSNNVLACLPPPDWEVPESEIAKRVDLRDELICSIDPPGCVDIDDALHCKLLPNGNFEVGCHIADPTWFIQPGSALDIEAANRATSVYLVERRIDMIPTMLSTDLASLHGGRVRLAFSCVWEMAPDAQIIETKFFRSVIQSKAALSYGEAQERLDKGLTDPLTTSIRQLNELAKILKRNRVQAGALELASTEVKFLLDKTNQEPTEVGLYQIKEVHSLVEEFMLLGNVSVGKRIYQSFPAVSLLRRHPTPKPDNFLPLIRAARCAGFQVDTASSKGLADSLNRCVDPNEPAFNKMIRILTTRCMTQAVYFQSGDFSSKEFLHYGLASPIYTHFTSPIRRYADMVVHRLLAAAIGDTDIPTSFHDRLLLRDQTEHINYRNRMARDASRSSTSLYILRYFVDKREEQDALITAVRSNGIRVLVIKYGLEGCIQLYKEPGEGEPARPNPYVLNEEELTLKSSTREFKIFQKIRVVIYVQESQARRKWLVIEAADPEIGKDKTGGNNPSTSRKGDKKRKT